MDGLLEKKAYKDIVFAWAADHGFTPVESEINDLLWSLEKIVDGKTSLTAPNPQPVSIKEISEWAVRVNSDSDGGYTPEEKSLASDIMFSLSDCSKIPSQPVSAALEAFERVQQDQNHGIYGNRTVDDHLRDIELVKQALAQNAQVWQPIETCPWDTMVLVYCPNLGITNEARIECVIAKNNSSGSHHAWATHWMPLPAAPVSAKEG